MKRENFKVLQISKKYQLLHDHKYCFDCCVERSTFVWWDSQLDGTTLCRECFCKRKAKARASKSSNKATTPTQPATPLPLPPIPLNPPSGESRQSEAS